MARFGGVSDQPNRSTQYPFPYLKKVEERGFEGVKSPKIAIFLPIKSVNSTQKTRLARPCFCSLQTLTKMAIKKSCGDF
jgi:hypothetical protein